MADKFESHRCPYCGRNFLIEMKGNIYNLAGSNDNHILTECPGCRNELYISSRHLYGVLANQVPNDDVSMLISMNED